MDTPEAGYGSRLDCLLRAFIVDGAQDNAAGRELRILRRVESAIRRSIVDFHTRRLVFSETYRRGDHASVWSKQHMTTAATPTSSRRGRARWRFRVRSSVTSQGTRRAVGVAMCVSRRAVSAHVIGTAGGNRNNDSFVRPGQASWPRRPGDQAEFQCGVEGDDRGGLGCVPYRVLMFRGYLMPLTICTWTRARKCSTAGRRAL